MKSDITVIIPTLSNGKTKTLVEASVSSLREFTSHIDILVVLNGESPLEPNVETRFLMKVKKQGQCNAVNRALEKIDTRYVMVSNDDMIFSPDWDKPLLKAVQEFKCVSPNLMEPEPGAPPFHFSNFGSNPKEFNKENWLKFCRTNKDEEIEKGFNLPFMTETEIFRTIEGYDENYDPYGSNSDSDVQYKFMISGISPHRVRASLVYHFSTRSSDPSQGEETRKDWWKNWRYFPRKWGFERQADNNIWYEPTIPTKEHP